MKKTTSNSVETGNVIPFLNPDRKPLTPDKLRELSGLTVSDEKADEIIHSIRMLCKVLYQFSNDGKNGYIEDQADYSSIDHSQNLAA